MGGVASAIGGISAGNKIARNIEDYQAQRDKIQANQDFSKAHMEAGMYAQPGQGASFNAAQTATLEALRQANQEAAQNVTGGASPAAKAAGKAAATSVAGKMMSQAAMQNEQQREQAYAQGQGAMQAWQQQDNQMLKYIADTRQQQAEAIKSAAGGAAGALNALSFGGKW